MYGFMGIALVLVMPLCEVRLIAFPVMIAFLVKHATCKHRILLVFYSKQGTTLSQPVPSLTTHRCTHTCICALTTTTRRRDYSGRIYPVTSKSSKHAQVTSYIYTSMYSHHPHYTTTPNTQRGNRQVQQGTYGGRTL
ncbi:hypothetical protein DFP73DRAFT_221374 [Morchella snyderi]|nr:hypothetical protein DFP73DRAFT_221374 [Morchella snyderi]